MVCMGLLVFSLPHPLHACLVGAAMTNTPSSGVSSSSNRSRLCRFQVSVHTVRQLDRSLFETYIERRADPIAGSLEPGIYAGYFDWRDCQTPAGNLLEPPGIPVSMAKKDIHMDG